MKILTKQLNNCYKLFTFWAEIRPRGIHARFTRFRRTFGSKPKKEGRNGRNSQFRSKKEDGAHARAPCERARREREGPVRCDGASRSRPSIGADGAGARSARPRPQQAPGSRTPKRARTSRPQQALRAGGPKLASYVATAARARRPIRAGRRMRKRAS